MKLEKNEYYTIKIDDIGSQGEGIGKIDGFTIFVENALPEDIVYIKIVKLKKNYGFGKLIKVIEPSNMRVLPKCDYFSQCGGCTLQHVDYFSQLKFKTKKVKDNIERIGGFENIDVLDAIGMEHPYNYRNKSQYPIGIKDNKLKIGFYSLRSHNIIDLDNCLIQNDANKEIVLKIKEFINENNIEPYNEITHKGIIRHLFIRIGYITKEIMICIVVNGNKFLYENKLIEKLKDIKNISSIILNFNSENTNVILGTNIKVIWGKPYINDFIENLKFNISPLSFYQINPIQTNILYNKVLEFLNLNGNEVVIDAYCGIGTISLFIAQKAKKVYGIEILKEAIDDANKNALLNNISNVEFITGKSEEIIPMLYKNYNIIPDVIVVDPPRKGCDESLLNVIDKIGPKKVIYISCDSATLARDLKILCKDNYAIKTIQPIDMFPQTFHIESVVEVYRK